MNIYSIAFVSLVFALSIILIARFKRDFIRGHHWYEWPLSVGIAALPGCLIVALVLGLSYGSAVQDTEIWSGEITAKERKHDSYVRSYQCNCVTTTDSRGNSSTTCQTCYEDHYTVDWYCHSNLGQLTVDSLDSTSRSVYNTPDPQLYTMAKVGDPASITHSYVNYVQAVPDSLFKKTGSADLRQKFGNMLPPYPDNVYNLYRIDRFVPVGFNFADAAQWNTDISVMQKDIGPKKQANVIIVVVKTDDPQYMYALQEAWDGANKNDIVLLIGSLDGVKIEWADVISWTKNEIFKVELRDAVSELQQIDRQKIIPLVHAQVNKNFERRRMREFEYLSSEIAPPTWLVVGTFITLVLGYLAAAAFIQHSINKTRRQWR